LNQPLAGFAMKTGRSTLVAALVLGTMCSCARNAALQSQPDANSTQSLQTQLIDREWRLYSPVYPAITAEGYPIEFEAGGRVRTKNLGLTHLWWLTEDLTLSLGHDAESPTMVLPFDSNAGVFVSQRRSGPWFVVGPRGFRFAEYLQERAAHGDRGRKPTAPADVEPEARRY